MRRGLTGKIKFDESPENAVIREANEELVHFFKFLKVNGIQDLINKNEVFLTCCNIEVDNKVGGKNASFPGLNSIVTLYKFEITIDQTIPINKELVFRSDEEACIIKFIEPPVQE